MHRKPLQKKPTMSRHVFMKTAPFQKDIYEFYLPILNFQGICVVFRRIYIYIKNHIYIYVYRYVYISIFERIPFAHDIQKNAVGVLRKSVDDGSNLSNAPNLAPSIYLPFFEMWIPTFLQIYQPFHIIDIIYHTIICIYIYRY